MPVRFSFSLPLSRFTLPPRSFSILSSIVVLRIFSQSIYPASTLPTVPTSSIRRCINTLGTEGALLHSAQSHHFDSIAPPPAPFRTPESQSLPDLRRVIIELLAGIPPTTASASTTARAHKTLENAGPSGPNGVPRPSSTNSPSTVPVYGLSCFLPPKPGCDEVKRTR